MAADIEDLIGTPARRKGRRRTATHKRKDHGELHHLIGRALPYLCDRSGVANLHKLAEMLRMTYAGVHKWVRPGMDRHKIPPKRVEEICELSEKFALSEEAPDDFLPVRKVDFLPYMY